VFSGESLIVHFENGAAFGTGDLAGPLLRLEPTAVTKTTLKLVATGAMQRKLKLRSSILPQTRLFPLFAIGRRQCKRACDRLSPRRPPLSGSTAFCR
jgi:hypothetical protein